MTNLSTFYFIIFVLLSPILLAQKSTQTPEVLRFKSNKCPNEALGLINQRVITLNKNKDTVKLVIGVIDNCILSDSISVTINADTININRFFLTDSKGNISNADCDCYRELEIEMIAVIDTSYCFQYKNKVLKKNTSKYPLNRYSITDDGDSIIISDKNGFSYYREYYDNGEIKTLRISKGRYLELFKFFENGQLQRSAQVFDTFDISILKEWNKEGTLIKYENTAIDKLNTR